jgi:hypothetical protein
MSVEKKKGFLDCQVNLLSHSPITRTFYVTSIKTDNIENVSNILQEHHQELASSETNAI